MKNETLEEQRLAIARLSGKVMALEFAVTALIAHHPDRERVGRFFATAVESLLDQTLPSPIPEEARDYLAITRDSILRGTVATT